MSDESTEDAWEWIWPCAVGVGVSVLLVVPVIGLVTGCTVVAMGAGPAFTAGPETATVSACATSNLSSGRSDHPSGIVTPGGSSALPAGMADALGRAACLCS